MVNIQDYCILLIQFQHCEYRVSSVIAQSFFFLLFTANNNPGWMDACVPCINLYTFTFSPENEVSKIVLLLVLLHWNGMDCFCVRKLAKLVVFLPFPPLHSSPSTTFFLGARSSFSLSRFLLIILVHSK